MLFSSIFGGRIIKVPIIESFDLNRFMGVWYEIARLDHPYERGLERVTAHYNFTDKSHVAVLNQGFKSGNIKTSRSARLLPTTKPNYFKVYFGFPIGFAYRVAYIDKHYTVAVITGSRSNTLWFMARTPTLEREIKKQLEIFATELGFDTSKLIYTKQV
jgi:apolipoprotein D and lipocalin family protein